MFQACLPKPKILPPDASNTRTGADIEHNAGLAFDAEYTLSDAQKELMQRTAVRMKRQSEAACIRGWHAEVQRIKGLWDYAGTVWLERELAVGFRTWRERLLAANRDLEHVEALFDRASRHLPRARQFSAFLDWVSFTWMRTRLIHEQDRLSIEAAIAVQELEEVWGSPLSTYPEPDSSANCDECGRTGCYRYYHATTGPDMADSVDLCESCYIGGQLASQMAPDVRNSFALVAPLIKATEAWRDVSDREREMDNMALVAQQADLAQKRSEVQFAVRVLESAAASTQVPLRERAMITAAFSFSTTVRVAVPHNSLAAQLGQRDPSSLGQAVLRIIEEHTNAPSLATLQAVVQERLMRASTDTSDLSDDDFDDDEYNGDVTNGVGFTIAQPAILGPTAHALQMSGARQSQVRGLAGSAAALKALTASTIASHRLSASAQQSRVLSSMLQRSSSNTPTSAPGQQSMEANFLLKQVSSIVASIELDKRVQRRVQFDKQQPPMQVSLPAACPAADMAPFALGETLLEAVRKASNVTQARQALNALLQPSGGDI